MTYNLCQEIYIECLCTRAISLKRLKVHRCNFDITIHTCRTLNVHRFPLKHSNMGGFIE